MQKTNFFDGKVKSSDVDRIFIATNFNPNDQGIDNNPRKALVRFEFMEILVRLAHEKYPLMRYTEAFENLYENDIKDDFTKTPIS